MAKVRVKYQMIEDAVNRIGTTDTGAVCLDLENVALEKTRRWGNSKRDGRVCIAYQYLTQRGIEFFSDVREIIDELKRQGKFKDIKQNKRLTRKETLNRLEKIFNSDIWKAV